MSGKKVHTYSFEKLEVWKLARKIRNRIFEITLSFPVEEKYGLVSQLRRCVLSIGSNIAEGAARKSPKERSRFYEIAHSSLVEIDTQLEIAKKPTYISKKDLNPIEDKFEHVFAMLSNLIKNT